MNALARGAGGTTEHAGNLLDGQIEVVVKGQGQQVVLRQPVEGRVQIDAVGPASLGSSDMLTRFDLVGTDHLPPPRPAHGSALVGDDRQEPGLEVRPVSEAIQLAPALQRRLLDGVLRSIPVFEHGHGKSEALIEHGREQLSKRKGITGPCAPEPILRQRVPDQDVRTGSTQESAVLLHGLTGYLSVKGIRLFRRPDPQLGLEQPLALQV